LMPDTTSTPQAIPYNYAKKIGLVG